MITAKIPWQYHILLRQTVPIVAGLLGCLALMLSLGYFYAREEILSTTRAQVQQFVQSIVRQNEYSRQWVIRSMPSLVHAIQKLLATPHLQQDYMDAQISSAISNLRGEQFIEVHYIKKGKVLSHYYNKEGAISKERVPLFFKSPPTPNQIRSVKKAYWSNPHMDKKRTLHIRYTMPLKDNQGKTTGRVTLSLGKIWLTEHIRSFSFFEHCIPFFLTSQGQWTLPSASDTSLAELKIFMQEKKSGINTVQWLNTSYLAIFMPSGEDNLLLGILIPRKDIFGDLDTNTQILLFMGVIILLLATYALYTTNKHFRLPLHQLLVTADTLAKGSFDPPQQDTVPVIRTQETRLLYKAMQRLHIALHQRMHDLTIMAKTRERLQGELQFARNIQNSLRPHVFPSHDKLEVAAFVHEAREVCGDMYDCFSLSEQEVCFVIGNVAEHGVPAALLTNRIMPVLHELMLAGFSPAKALEHAHQLFTLDKLDKHPSNLLVSALVGILHLDTGQLTWASAGQLPPYILPSPEQRVQGTQGAQFFQLPFSACPPLGHDSHKSYTQQSQRILPGQSILFLPQRMLALPSPQGELYGEKALQKFLQQSSLAPKALLQALYKDICIHMHRVLRDDMILFALRFAAQKTEEQAKN